MYVFFHPYADDAELGFITWDDVQDLSRAYPQLVDRLVQASQMRSLREVTTRTTLHPLRLILAQNPGAIFPR